MREPDVRRVTGYFQASKDLSLFQRAWLPASPRAALVVVHGLGDHSGRYDAFGGWLAARGYAVHAFDARGHGRSTGRRVHVDRFEDFVADLGPFVALVRREHADLPVAVLGHSMGGLVVLSYLCDRKPSLAAAVTSGPALDISSTMPDWQLALGSVASRLLPWLHVPNGLPPEGLSRDPDVVQRYLDDPLVSSDLTLALAAALGQTARRTVTRGAEIGVPLLMLHGGQDEICLPDGSRRLFRDVRSPHSELKVYPGLRHEIFNEPEREQVYADVDAWLTARLVSGVESRPPGASPTPAG